jgi:hypothetical protein
MPILLAARPTKVLTRAALTMLPILVFSDLPSQTHMHVIFPLLSQPRKCPHINRNTEKMWKRKRKVFCFASQKGKEKEERFSYCHVWSGKQKQFSFLIYKRLTKTNKQHSNKKRLFTTCYSRILHKRDEIFTVLPLLLKIKKHGNI